MGFYDTLSEYYDIIFPANQIQLDFLKQYAKDIENILDIAAGSGNQAIELAKQGSKVTAIDFDHEMVNKIRHKSEQEGLHILAEQMDMRDIHQFPKNSFGLLTCIGNSIVHLDSYDEIQGIVNKMYDLLTNEGLLIIQIVNYDRILKKLITQLPLIENKDKGVTFIRTYEHLQSKIVFNGKLIIDSGTNKETFTNSVDLYPLTSNELVNTIKASGFTDYKLFGDFKGSSFTEESSALIVVARKKQKDIL